MVRGVRRAIVFARMWVRGYWIAVRAYRDPWRALRVVVELAQSGVRRGLIAPSWVPKVTRAAGRHFAFLYVPGYPSPAFDRYVHQELDREAPFLARSRGLHSAVVAITKRCGLACEHCFEWEALNQPEAVSRSDLIAIVGRLQRHGVAQIFFTGGEPLARFDDLVALTEASAHGSDLWVITSGRGLTASKARRLREAGLTGVAFSLEHWDAAGHDAFRGAPRTFEAVERGSAFAREAGLVAALSFCPVREFVSEDALEQYGLTARRLGVSFIQILEPRAVGHYAGKDVALSAEQVRMLEEWMDRLNASPESSGVPGVAYIDRHNRQLGCQGAGDRYLYIDTDGALQACPYCRAPGPSALEGDLTTAIAGLRRGGCPAARSGERCGSATAGSVRAAVPVG